MKETRGRIYAGMADSGRDGRLASTYGHVFPTVPLAPFLGFHLESVSQPGNNPTRVLVKTSVVGDYQLLKCTVLISVTVRNFANCCFKKQSGMWV